MLGNKTLHAKAKYSVMPHRLAFLYGAANIRSYEGAPDLEYRIGANSAQFTKGDIVTFSSGFLAVASADSRPVGICDLSATMTSNNQTVAKQEVPFIPASDELLFEMDFNDSSAVEGDIGSFYQLTGTTGAMLVNRSTKSATVGPVVLVKLDPRGEGSAVRGLFKFAKGFQSYTVAS